MSRFPDFLFLALAFRPVGARNLAWLHLEMEDGKTFVCNVMRFNAEFLTKAKVGSLQAQSSGGLNGYGFIVYGDIGMPAVELTFTIQADAEAARTYLICALEGCASLTKM